ncbi:hypothetical protein ACFQY5_05610 [Paeniroseomonas aquatica]|uniref:hypothetical protein n=1 Tax=Paeniroseomonas aquatica TaxID=373043 RepID=UPI003615A186
MGTDCAPHNLIEEMRLAILLARNAGRDLAGAIPPWSSMRRPRAAPMRWGGRTSAG